jgi:3-deoxy-D-manno-octulosonate 8-phosphate phosphatase (KDO 8-P phosphatase)
MGDDLPDVPVLQAVGFGASVINGHPQAIKAAQWTSTRRGGDGAVREWCDLILESKS